MECSLADPETIYNWRRLDDRITTSGQPNEAQLAEIHALGVHHIVNLGLHTSEKALPDEAASVGRLGMTYIHIPVDFQNPTNQDFEQFCSVMERLMTSPYTSTASRTIGSQRSAIGIVAMCSAWTRPRCEVRWKPSGTQTASGRRLWTARARAEDEAIAGNHDSWVGWRCHASIAGLGK
jgi:protein tyrosine phosphatase (PTP) superfamily phosphohydrolase (DUF442 family)